MESNLSLTMLMATNAARGCVPKNQNSIRQDVENHPCFGCCKKRPRSDVQSILTDLIYKDCLAELHRTTARGWGVVYLVKGNNYNALLQRQIAVTITKKKAVAAAKESVKEEDAAARATNDGLVDDGLGIEVPPRLSREQCKALYKELLASRRMLQSIFNERASILTPEVIEEIAHTVPLTEAELMTIDKMTPNSVKVLSGPILSFIQGWLKEKKIVVTKPFLSRGLLRRQQQQKMIPKNARGSRLALANQELMKKEEEDLEALWNAAEKMEKEALIDEDLLAAADEVEKSMSQSVLSQSGVSQSGVSQSSVSQSTLNQSTLNQSTLNQSTLNQSTLTPPDSKRVSLSSFSSSPSSGSSSRYFRQDAPARTSSPVTPTKQAIRMLGRKVVKQPGAEDYPVVDLTTNSPPPLSASQSASCEFV